MFYVSNIRESMGHQIEAQSALDLCLEIRGDAMPLHPETGLTHHRMGVFLSRQGKTVQAV